MYWLVGLLGIAIIIGAAVWVFTSWRFRNLNKGSECVTEIESEEIKVSDNDKEPPSETKDNGGASGVGLNLHASDFLKPILDDGGSQLVRGAKGAALGSTSIQEKASRILSRIGTMRPEPLASREAFMRGVLPAAKRSRYMIPIQI